MKINRFYLILITAAVGCNLYALSNRIKKINPKGKKIVFIGDSHTNFRNFGWQNVLAKQYEFNQVNLSAGAKRTDWMLQTLQNYLNNNTCDAVFIYGGANDAYSNVSNSTAVANIQKMIDLCNKKKITPIVVLGYDPMVISFNRVKPTTNVPTQQGINELTKKYAEQQKLAAKKLQNAIVVPVWNGGKKTDTIDALHLTPEAQKRFANFIGNKVFRK